MQGHALLLGRPDQRRDVGEFVFSAQEVGDHTGLASLQALADAAQRDAHPMVQEPSVRAEERTPAEEVEQDLVGVVFDHLCQ